jgi:hypothetical protein
LYAAFEILGEIAARRTVGTAFWASSPGSDCVRRGSKERSGSMKKRRSSRGEAGRPSKVGPDRTRVPDKLPRRAPRRPEGARHDGNRPTGLKRRLGG